MRGWTLRVLLIAGLVMAGAACDSETPTIPTNPTVTDTFSGTLNQNGAAGFQFTALASGTVTARLTTLAPDSALRIGLGLGNWNGTACQVVVANEAATQGSSINGSLGSAATLCLRVYDVGNVGSDPVTFTVEVEHP